MAVVEALGDLKDRRSVLPLIDALKDENWQIRKEAIEALGDIEDQRAMVAK